MRGAVRTNGLENFWSLLKRAIKGTYASVEPFHLFRYLDEEAFRFNARKSTDAKRFLAVLRTIAGRRLTYKSLVGQEDGSLYASVREGDDVAKAETRAPTPYERFVAATKAIVSVSKTDNDKDMQARKKRRKRMFASAATPTGEDPGPRCPGASA